MVNRRTSPPKVYVGGLALSLFLWAILGAFVGAASTTLFDRIAQWPEWALFGAAIFGALGYYPAFRGQNGIPVTALSASLLGWFIGSLVPSVWQIGAVGILGGAAGGIYLGMRLQAKFTRNTRRADPGSGSFYRS